MLQYCPEVLQHLHVRNMAALHTCHTQNTLELHAVLGGFRAEDLKNLATFERIHQVMQENLRSQGHPMILKTKVANLTHSYISAQHPTALDIKISTSCEN